MRKVYPYHPTREQYMKQQEAEQLKILRSPRFSAMLASCTSRKVGNHYVIESKNPSRLAVGAAIASYITIIQQGRARKPMAVCRAEARASAKSILEQYDQLTQENLDLVIEAAREHCS